MSRFQPSFDLKRIQESLTDAARVGSREVVRGVNAAKRQLERMQLVQKRKEHLAELGRALWEARQDGFPEAVSQWFNDTEFREIFEDLEKVDQELERLGEGQEV